MTEDHDSKLSNLYRQSSQETPAAHLDRAVLDMARKSVHPRLLSPFGNHWAAGGALAGVVMLSVLLILTVPQQPDSHAPARDAIAPSSEALPETRKETIRMQAAPSVAPSRMEKKRAAPAAPRARFRFFEESLDRGEGVPADEDRAHLRQSPAPAAETPVGTVALPSAEIFYLQAGSFREQARADELKAKLAELGFEADIQVFSINTPEVYHRVRVGPYTDLDMLEAARRKLAELEIETRAVTVGE